MKFEVPSVILESNGTWATRLEQYRQLVVLRAKDGLTIPEFAEIVLGAMRLAVSAADESPLENADRKAWVLSIVAALFDQLSGLAVPVAYMPLWVVVRPAIRALCLSLASGGIEFMLTVTRGNQ